MKDIRIAKVKATGARYVVQRLDFGKAPKALVWGEVVAMRGTQTKHAGSKQFALSEVEVVNATKTETLVAELFQQAFDACLRGEVPGYTVANAKRRAEAQRKQKKLSGEEFLRMLENAVANNDYTPAINYLNSLEF
jgi:hypothetical protein